MRTEINVLFLNFDQTEIDAVNDQLLEFEYTLNCKLINIKKEGNSELINNNWDIVVAKNAEGVLDDLNTIPGHLIVVSEDWNLDFIKSVFKNPKWDFVYSPGQYDISLAIIKNYLKSALIKTDKLSEEALKKINKLKSDLATKSKELENVVYITSHDIRSPVVNILGFSDELIKALKKLSEKVFDEANTIQNKNDIEYLLKKDIPQIQGFIKLSGEKIERLLVALLKLSRLGRADLTNINVDLNKVINNILSGFEGTIRDANIKIEVEQLPLCFTDETIIIQVFTSIIENAIRFRSNVRDAIINIRAKENEEYITYCIRDNGIGISEDDVNKIFDVFYKVNPEYVEGEGIGLSYSKKAMERLGGEISVKSLLEDNSEGKEGATEFCVTIKKQTV